MTSRQRILAAARRQPVDRLPVSLYELDDVSDGWAAGEPSYRPLLELQRRCGDLFAFAACGAGLFEDPSEARDSCETFESRIDTPRGPLRRISRRDRGIATTWTIKHWIESRYRIEIAKQDPRVLKIKDRIDAEYAVDRVSAISDQEMAQWVKEAFGSQMPPVRE